MLGRLRVRQNFRLPRRFWKVLALAGTGQRLETAAFMVDQSSFLEEWTAKGQESIAANAPTIDEPAVTEEPSPRQSGVAAFRTSVAEIENQTGLDFGEKLRNAAPIQD